jgi:integrase
MRGNITRRGRESWRIRFDVADGSGKRKQQTVTVRGTKRQAEAKLAELLASVSKGTFVEPSKLTVAELVRARLAQWIASGKISDKTAERYGELIEHQIAPFIGGKMVQRLKPADIEAWHSALRTGGRKNGGALSARTIGHAHRVPGQGPARCGEVRHGGPQRRRPGRRARANARCRGGPDPGA